MINWGVWKYPNPPTEANEEEVIAKEAPMENPFEGDEMFQEAGGEWTEKKISYDRDVFEAFINKDMDVTLRYGPNFGLYHSIGTGTKGEGNKAFVVLEIGEPDFHPLIYPGACPGESHYKRL